MSNENRENAAPPRILLALPPGRLREHLLKLFRDRDVDVVCAEEAADFATSSAPQGDLDLIIVRRDDLSAADERALGEIAVDSAAPDVVVVGPDLDEATQVELVAAGATEVIDVTRLDGRAADTLEALAVGEGGHAEPDSALGAVPSLSDFSSHSKIMHALMDLVQRVGPTDSTLLITGETGVGKEHLARAIHAGGERASHPFVAVNCGALPEELLESELFGHTAGAFTGAKKARAGAFASAEHGTLLLDEIGEMPKHLQIKLLRVLQRGELRPVGSDETRHVDVRILAATNRDLRAEIAAGRFREDLYFRLNVVELALPPLRERREDLPTLVGALMRHYRIRTGRSDLEGVDPDTVERLMSYEWPGNVRELTNVIERAMLVSRGPRIGIQDLPTHLRTDISTPTPGANAASLSAPLLDRPWKEAREALLRTGERAYLEAVLRACDGAIGETAAKAGLSTRSLYEKMKRHGLKKEDFRAS